jgi:AcrR family transcriptional regulator
VKSRAKTNSARRKPIQEQAQVTVEAMLDAAVKLLKRSGAASLTTNRIAETAGGSIGCVYQYFPNERAIFIAPHEMHIRQVDRVMQRRTAASAEATLEDLISSMVDGTMRGAYRPELSDLLHVEVPHRADGSREFSVHLQGRFGRRLLHMQKELGGRIDLEMRAFFVGNMPDALGHAIVVRRRLGSSLSRSRAELIRADSSYFVLSPAVILGLA